MYSNISSIGASFGWMNASANNVANINTKGFTPTDTVIADKTNLSPQAIYEQSSTKGTDLAKEMTNQNVISDTVGLNVNTINTQNEMTKTLLDLKA